MLLFDYQVFANMAGFSALTGLVSGTKLCSNREQTNQKAIQVFMCACQPAFFRLGQRDSVLRRRVCWLKSLFSKLVNHGWMCSRSLTQLLIHAAPRLCPDLLPWALGLSFWSPPGVQEISVHSNKVTHLVLPQHWLFKSKWRGKTSSEVTALLFSSWLNLRAKYNSLPIFRSVFSFGICFPLQCWANVRRGPAAEGEKKILH